MALINLPDTDRDVAIRLLGADAVEPEGRRLIAWDEAGTPVACAAVSRTEAGEVELHALAVDPGARGRGVGSALVQGLAAAVNAPALVATAPAEARRFLVRCGFDVDETGRARLAIEPEPDPSPSTPLTLSAIEAAVRAAWSADTADDPSGWTADNPARDQCAVTALVVRELLGGEILVANVLRDGRRVEAHAWNVLPSGLELDLTREQFRNGETLERPRRSEPLAGRRDPERYGRFARRVREQLGLG